MYTYIYTYVKTPQALEGGRRYVDRSGDLGMDVPQTPCE